MINNEVREQGQSVHSKLNDNKKKFEFEFKLFKVSAYFTILCTLQKRKETDKLKISTGCVLFSFFTTKLIVRNVGTY